MSLTIELNRRYKTRGGEVVYIYERDDANYPFVGRHQSDGFKDRWRADGRYWNLIPHEHDLVELLP